MLGRLGNVKRSRTPKVGYTHVDFTGDVQLLSNEQEGREGVEKRKG